MIDDSGSHSLFDDQSLSHLHAVIYACIQEKKVRENYALSTAFEFACLQLVRYWRNRGASWDATTPFIQLVALYLFHFSSESPELS